MIQTRRVCKHFRDRKLSNFDQDLCVFYLSRGFNAQYESSIDTCNYVTIYCEAITKTIYDSVLQRKCASPGISEVLVPLDSVKFTGTVDWLLSPVLIMEL